MRNMLALLAAATLTVVGIGWYLGWYRVSSAPAEEGKRRVNIEFDTTRINADLHKGGARLHDVLPTKRSAPGGQEPSQAP